MCGFRLHGWWNGIRCVQAFLVKRRLAICLTRLSGEECCKSFIFHSRSQYEFHESLDCGDVTDVQAAGVTFAPEADCSLPCPGDPIHLCGAGNRIQYYVWTGTPPYVWNQPTTNIGYYEVCRAISSNYCEGLT
jgi:hypothetical protein